jgi:hypothetical protein
MPPFKPFKSGAPHRKLRAMAARGDIATSEVEGKEKATAFDEIPERVGPTPPARSRGYGATPTKRSPSMAALHGFAFPKKK